MTRLIPMNAPLTPKVMRSSLRRPGDIASMLRLSARCYAVDARSPQCVQYGDALGEGVECGGAASSSMYYSELMLQAHYVHIVDV
jgi:hypothetical protein